MLYINSILESIARQKALLLENNETGSLPKRYNNLSIFLCIACLTLFILMCFSLPIDAAWGKVRSDENAGQNAAGRSSMSSETLSHEYLKIRPSEDGTKEVEPENESEATSQNQNTINSGVTGKKYHAYTPDDEDGGGGGDDEDEEPWLRHLLETITLAAIIVALIIGIKTWSRTRGSVREKAKELIER